jgi:outer membrane protein TolC
VLARLEAATNLTGLDTFAIAPISDSDLALLPLNDDSVMTAVLDNNPNIAGLDHLIASSEANISAVSRENLPKFSLGFDYIQTGAALVPTMKDSGKDPMMVSVGLSLPLWFGKYKARTESARALNRAAVYQKEEATNQLHAYTQQALYDYADALRQFNLYRDDLTHRAEMAFDVSYTAYENGKVEFLSLLDAQRQLLSFQWQLEQAVTKGRKRERNLIC